MIPRSLSRRALRIASAVPSRSRQRTLTHLTRPSTRPQVLSPILSSIVPSYNQPTRPFASHSNKSTADAVIDDITELFATAKDEFEIAMEETEKVTVYAEEDRKAAREELTKVQEAYQAVVEGSDQQLAEEVKGRIGQRIRELEQGVKAMEEMAMNQD